MVDLDRTEQRVVGTLIEKQFSVPDSYPLSENALVDGCNQKNNRDPVTELASFQVAGALMALQEKGVVAKVDGGGRVPRFRHKLDEVLQVGKNELTIFAELLLRGPQAPGALKPRVARMGYHASPEQIEAALRELAARSPALVELLPLGPRERDRRWRHRLGDGSDGGGAEPGSAGTAESPRLVPAALRPIAPVPVPEARPIAAAPPPETRPIAPAPAGDLAARVAVLEAEVRALRAELGALRERG